MIAALFLLLATPQTAPVPAPAAQTAADLDTRLAKARIIVETSMPIEQRDKMFHQMLDAMMSNMIGGMMQGDPQLAKSLKTNTEAAKLLASFVERQKKLALEDLTETGPEMVEAMASAYAKRFSLAELTEVEAFVATPTGARFFQAGTQILNDPAVAEWQRKLFAKAQAREEAELRRLIDELTPLMEKHDAQPSNS
ncbi:DUF2059 domain-containing protein [Sphingomonas koreensis]|uniref:DUF2059 domain-containing protein n=1 Tax=Sphingomonas koreensis TaxID=93064 RepID=UPI0008317ACE|nr:DUF2059 domain-containing protein [Sphingomonas koreensis]PJI88517.1 hypothetical protein BDW16_1799 [Sphingomonas koreensis]RSU58890.1 DUF2059 domain-containing protein [Sphingomonas koreensis]RSU67256.1 DUF2059 domain-containing protein [Sphingomonas koreensis]